MAITQWQCRNGHVLGVLRLNGNRSSRLMIYRHAVDLNVEQPAQVDVMIGPLVGQMPVQCDICGDVKLWDVSVDDLAQLIYGLKHEEKLQLRTLLMQGEADKARKLRSRARFE